MQLMPCFQVQLTLMPAKQGILKRLVTLAAGSTPIMRDVSRWRKLKRSDLLGKGDGLVLQPADSFAQTKYGWYLLPSSTELKRPGPNDPPDSSRGKVGVGVLPYTYDRAGLTR